MREQGRHSPGKMTEDAYRVLKNQGIIHTTYIAKRWSAEARISAMQKEERSASTMLHDGRYQEVVSVGSNSVTKMIEIIN